MCACLSILLYRGPGTQIQGPSQSALAFGRRGTSPRRAPDKACAAREAWSIARLQIFS